MVIQNAVRRVLYRSASLVTWQKIPGAHTTPGNHTPNSGRYPLECAFPLELEHYQTRLDLPGAPSTQLLTRQLCDAHQSLMNPCTITPLHLGHRIDSVLMLEPPENELEEVVIR